jgi:hypothetical protein
MNSSLILYNTIPQSNEVPLLIIIYVLWVLFMLLTLQVIRVPDTEWSNPIVYLDLNMPNHLPIDIREAVFRTGVELVELKQSRVSGVILWRIKIGNQYYFPSASLVRCRAHLM